MEQQSYSGACDRDGNCRRGLTFAPNLAPQMKPIIPGMNKPDHVFSGVMLCGDCGKPLRLGAGGVFGMQESRMYAEQAQYPGQLASLGSCE
jgi:hypothetical protein